MRILIEVISAEFGGIKTYVENLLRAWPARHPDDDLLVVVPSDSSVDTSSVPRHEVRIPRPNALGRPWVQSIDVPRIADQWKADAVLATLPATSIRRTGVPTAVVIYDFRHELRPEQFSPARRLLRRVSYGRGYAIADAFISISQRSLDDLHRLHPRTRSKPSFVAHLGADHVRDWPGQRGTGPAITFSHHTNKNPDLVIDGWAYGVRRGLLMPRLLILGTGSLRESLQRRIDASSLAKLVELAPFLPDEEFIERMGSASMVVFPSDFEGFGLPVVEGMWLGVPVVIGPEPATMEVAGGWATVLDGWTPGALADAVHAAAQADRAHLEAARKHAETFTWARCVEQTREALQSITR